MLRGRALAPLLLVLIAAAPAASAEYGVGSELSADDPVTLTGRADALVRSGVAGFVSGGREQVALTLTAAELHLRFTRMTTTCAAGLPLGSGCAQPPQPSVEEARLVDATVTVVQPLGAYKAIVTNDPRHADTFAFGRGAILTVTGGTTQLTTNREVARISPYQADWSAGSQGAAAYSEPVYEIPAWTPKLAAGGNLMEASGNFEALLQGLRVRVDGRHAEGGGAYSETFDTAYPASGGTYSFLVVESREGALVATSAAPVTAFGARDVDVAEGGSAAFARADGRVVADGAEQRYQAQDARLAGPLAIKDLQVEQGTPARLRAQLSSDLFLADELPSEEQDESSELRQLATAAAVGAGGAGALAAALYFWPRAKYALTLLLLPMYTRIERTQVLEHSKRDEIYQLIQSAPGIHAHEIGERTQIGWGTTVYHLKMLESHSLVVSKKTGRYKRFYVNTGEYTKKKDVYAALRNETAKRVADFVVNHPGTSQKELCEALGIQPSLASWHVEKLEGVGLVKRVKDGRQVRYFAGPAWTDLNVRLTPGGGAETVAET